MNDIQIRCFLETAKYRSFSKAAKLLFLSQPTVSRNIGELEREWNIKLFDRHGGNVTVTDAGRRMADFWEVELAKFSEVLEDVRKSVGGGELCIALLNGQMINSILREAILKMKELYPEIKIGMQRFDYSEIRDQLILKKADIAELPQNAISFKAQESRAYCKYETYLVIPDNSSYAYQSDLELKLFLKENLIMVDKKDAEPDLHVGIWISKCNEYKIEPHIKWVSDIKQQEMLVELGEGVAICNINHMMTNSPHTRFVKIREFDPMPFDLIWNMENKNPAVEKFLKCVDFRPDEII